jgi:hypothetical protein
MMDYRGYKIEALHGNFLHKTYSASGVIWQIVDPNKFEDWSLGTVPMLLASGFASESECRSWIDNLEVPA